LIVRTEIRADSRNSQFLEKIPCKMGPYQGKIGSETGSYLTAHTTIQSCQTTDSQTGVKQAVSVGISGHFIMPFRSLVTAAVFRPNFGVRSLHRKIPFPAAGCGGSMPSGRPEIMAVLGTKNARSSQAAIISGSIRAPRTGRSIRLAHRATVRRRCLAAADLRRLL
jgi:hypothetical protein